MLEFILDRANYWLIFILMMVGLYIVFAAQNLIKRLVGLSVFQTSVFLFYITLSMVSGGSAPILHGRDYPKAQDGQEADGPVAEAGASEAANYGYGVVEVYSNPLPHVLILTAIVVGVATLAVGLAIVVRIREAYGTIEADELRDMDMDVALAEEAENTEKAEAGAAG